MTRIIAGAAGSLSLDVPPSGTRPTSDRVREAMFSSLTSWNMLEGRRVLDLYAGSGALALEAVSRGASHAVLVEKHPPAAAIAERNARRVEAAIAKQGAGASAPSIVVVRQTAHTYLDGQADGARFDVVLIDPPYDISEASLTTTLEKVAPHLTPDAVVMVERSSRSAEPSWPQQLELIRDKRYGETTLWWAELAE